MDTNIENTIGYRIKKIRQKKFPGRGGAKKAADTVGVTRAEWSRYEHSKNLHHDTMKGIAKTLGVNIDELSGQGGKSPLALTSGEGVDKVVIRCMEVQEALARFSGSLLSDRALLDRSLLRDLVAQVRKLQATLSDSTIFGKVRHNDSA